MESISILWEHEDGRTLLVHPDAKGTQAILAKAGYGPVKLEETETETGPVRVVDLDLPPTALKRLDEAGYASVERIRQASDSELLAIKGFGQKSLGLLRAQL